MDKSLSDWQNTYRDSKKLMRKEYLVRKKNKYFISALLTSIIWIITLPLWLFCNYVVLFRTGSIDLFCEKQGIYSDNTTGSVPFDLKSYTCGGYRDVFSNFDIVFYYLTSIIIIIGFLLSIYLFLMYEKYKREAWIYRG